MRAWQVVEHGTPREVLRLADDVAAPTPGVGEITVAVDACALNFADSLLCAGTYQEKPPLPFTPGLEVAGRVAAVGDAAGWEVGDLVCGSPLLPHGGLAEVALARSSDVFTVPAGVDVVSAAAMHVTYQTAWFALHRRAQLTAGETVVVHAGAGGTGGAAVELARASGATVIATAGGPAKVARCLELGAAHAIDHRSEDVAGRINELTDGRGADVIIDPVGGDTFVASTKCIAWEGRIVVVGAASGRYAELRTNHAMVKDYTVLGLNWRGYLTRRPDLVAEAQAALFRLVRDDAIHPDVTERLALGDDIPAAVERITSGQTTGKLVVLPR